MKYNKITELDDASYIIINYTYRISSKNSAPLIIRHPLAQIGKHNL